MKSKETVTQPKFRHSPLGCTAPCAEAQLRSSAQSFAACGLMEGCGSKRTYDLTFTSQGVNWGAGFGLRRTGVWALRCKVEDVVPALLWDFGRVRSFE